MGDILSGVFLLVSLAAVVFVKATVLCPFGGNWKYDTHTGTCMSLQETHLSFKNANIVCASFQEGNKRNIPGHLVYIFDKKTNEFVKGLLGSSDKKALIGLNDRLKQAKYRWGDATNSQNLSGYTGWAKSQPSNEPNDRSVLITEKGWKKYDGTAQFVCQVEPVMPSPKISCPAAEVGQRSSDIVCSLDIPNEQITLTAARFNRAGSFLSSPFNGYRIEKLRQTRENSWTSVLQILNVRRDDEVSWSCSVKFANDVETTSAPCDLKVYTLPSTVECSVSFFQETMTVSCTARNMYPSANCQWDIKMDRFNQKVSYQNVTSAWWENKMITANFNASITRPGAGDYQFKVAVYPSVPGLYQTKPPAIKTGSLKVTLKWPLSPVLYSSQGALPHLTLKENQTFILSCEIKGGTPEVYSTVIWCYSQQPHEFPGNVAHININITPKLHNQRCFCYGRYLAGNTSEAIVTILVESSPRITSFAIQNKESYEVEAYNYVQMECAANGYPQYQLLLTYYQDVQKTQTKVDSIVMTHEIFATCDSMGRYWCVAENSNKQKDSKHVQLNVRCAPKNCPNTQLVPTTGAAVGSTTAVKMCVHAYPAPMSYRLFKGEDTNRTEHGVPKYHVNFTYTDEERGQGAITVTIFPVDQHDFGVYSLQSNTQQGGYRSSFLKFELVARGPPSCPENLTESMTFADSITLSWKPGFDGGLQQSFTILRYDSGLTTEPQTVSVIPQPAGNLEVEMSYNVTGLSERTTYTFGLRAENEEGVANCTLQVQGLTKASPLSGQRLTTTILPVVLVLILVIIVVVVFVFVVVRRRRSRGVLKQDTAQVPKAHTSSSSNTDDHEANANAKLEHRLAAQGIPKVNNFSKGATEEVGQDNTFAVVVKDNTKKGKKQKRRELEEINGAVIHSKKSDYVTMNPGQAVADGDGVYANVAWSSKAGQGKPSPPRDDGRTVTEDGLIYAEVTINVKTTNPEIKGQARPKVAKLPPKVEEPGVEYMQLDFVATARHK